MSSQEIINISDQLVQRHVLCKYEDVYSAISLDICRIVMQHIQTNDIANYADNVFNHIIQRYDLYDNIDMHLENKQDEAKLYSDVWRLFRSSDITDKLKIPILQQNKELEKYIIRRNIKVIPMREHTQFMSAIYSVDEVFSRSSEILDELSSSNDSIVEN